MNAASWFSRLSFNGRISADKVSAVRPAGLSVHPDSSVVAGLSVDAGKEGAALLATAESKRVAPSEPVSLAIKAPNWPLIDYGKIRGLLLGMGWKEAVDSPRGTGCPILSLDYRWVVMFEGGKWILGEDCDRSNLVERAKGTTVYELADALESHELLREPEFSSPDILSLAKAASE